MLRSHSCFIVCITFDPFHVGASFDDYVVFVFGVSGIRLKLRKDNDWRSVYEIVSLHRYRRHGRHSLWGRCYKNALSNLGGVRGAWV
jgi:hypothetical protein